MKKITGNFYQSVFRSTWTGIELCRQRRKGIGDLITLLVVYDRSGNRMEKKMIKVLDIHWLRARGKQSVSVRKDWGV